MDPENSPSSRKALLAAKVYRIAPPIAAVVILDLMVCVAMRTPLVSYGWLVLAQILLVVLSILRGVQGWSLAYLMSGLALSSFILIPLLEGERELPLFASGVAAVAWLYVTVHGRDERRGYGKIERLLLVKGSVYLLVAVLGFVLILLSLLWGR